MGLFEVYKKALMEKGKAVQLRAKATADLAAAQQEKLGDEIIAGFRNDVETHKKAAEEAEDRRVQAAEGFFSTYANLLFIEARITWDNILECQIGTAPWTDLKGKRCTVVQSKTKMSFDDCITHHLLTVFTIDSAE